MEIATELTPDEKKFFETDGQHIPENEKQTLKTNEKDSEEFKSEDQKPVFSEDSSKEEVKEKHKEQPKEKSKAEEKKVSLAALHEERARNVELRNRLNELERRLSSPEKEKKFEIPDVDKDALGALRATAEQVREIAAERKRVAEQSENLEFERRIISDTRALEREFSEENPDYNEAAQFLVQNRINELVATGMYSPIDAEKTLKQEAFLLAFNSLKSGRNPAEAIYAIAKTRGYTGKKSEVADTNISKDKANTIERVAAGIEEAKSLGGANGGKVSGGSQLDGKTLASMSQEQFDKFYEKLDRNDLKKIMGD